MHDRAPAENGMNASRFQSPRKRSGLNVLGSCQYFAANPPSVPFCVPVRYQLTVEVQRDRGQVDLCALRTRDHDRFAVLVFGPKGRIEGAYFGYVEHEWEHSQGFVEDGLDIREADNVRV
jgi:hypothetical protein